MSKTVMVIDDEKYICKVVSELLKGAGYEVLSANSGEQALETLNSGKIPDLALVDFFMPGMNGKEFVKKVREDTKLKNLRMVFFTVALLSKKDYQDLEQLGIMEFIQKPFDGKFLLDKVKTILLDKK